MISGITLGSLYALVGIGFVIIYKATGVLNFAQGEMIMLGAMFALVLHMDQNMPYLPAVLSAIALAALLGVLLEVFIYRWLFRAPEATVILSTVAVAQMIRAGVGMVRGQEVSRFPSFLSLEPFSIWKITVPPLGLGIIGVVFLLVILLLLFFPEPGSNWG